MLYPSCLTMVKHWQTRRALGGAHVPPTNANWVRLYVVQKSRPDPGNSLALGLQHGVNSISLQCIPWPVACSEWGACLTDFDRSSTFRFSGSGIRTMIRNGLKSWSVRPCRHAKFHTNPCMRFWVILLTDRQTYKHRGQSQSPFSEVNIVSIH